MSKDNKGEDLSRRRLLQMTGTGGVAGAIGLTGTASALGDAEGDTDLEVDPYSDPEYPSDEWFAREQSNWQKTREEPIRQANDPGFTKRLEEQSSINYVEYRERDVEEEWTWVSLCYHWQQQCVGDPFMYPAEEPVWSGDPFYDETGDVQRVVFYDSSGEDERLNGRVWKPMDAEPGDELPGVVVMNGGAATETMYWWFAQSLVENGYVALTFDPVGQGRSEGRSRSASEHQVDAIDFFLSTPEEAYPHNQDAEERGDEDTVPITDYNPFHDVLDRSRIGTAGHSMGASSTSQVQAIPDGEWPGVGDDNPLDVAVAWDSLNDDVTPRVPTMDQRADYRSEVHGWVPSSKAEPPDPDARKDSYYTWRDEDVPVFSFTIRGSTHFEWSRVPTFPATSWESWGNEMADFFSIAWFDHWLKRNEEPGGDDAERRLLTVHDDPWENRLSFYYDSAYYFPSNPNHPPNQWHHCEDVLNCDP